MSGILQEWLDRELQDYEPVHKSFRNKQHKRYYIWMVVIVAGMLALGFAGYDWTHVVRVHLPIGVIIAALIYLCGILISDRAVSMKNARKQFEKALSTLSPSDQEAFARQDFGRADFLKMTGMDVYPARLLVGQDFWLYFRNVCCIYRVADMEKLQIQQEKTQLHYFSTGNVRVRQRIDPGVSIVVGYRDGTISKEQQHDRLPFINWEQARTAKDLIVRHCPKTETLWEKDKKNPSFPELV